jgi:hypothetical protein
MATGPVILSSAFKNESHPLFWMVASIGGLICLAALYFGFKAIKLIVSFLFDPSDPTK